MVNCTSVEEVEEIVVEGCIATGFFVEVTVIAATRFLSGREVLTAGFWCPGLAPR